MPCRQPLPRLWLMTDERMGDALLPAVARLPRGSGVVFRHPATPSAERRRLFAAVRQVARARRLVLLLAGSPAQARAWRADGVHGRAWPAVTGLVRSAPVHDRRELVAAVGAAADILFISPVFVTRSHARARPLGRVRFGLLAQHARGQAVVALGGMTPRRYAGLRAWGADGWAAIDALT